MATTSENNIRFETRIEQPTAVPAELLDELRQGFCVFDGEHRLVSFNRRYVEIYGLQQGALSTGMTLGEVVDARYEAGTGPNLTREEYLLWRRDVAVANSITESIVQLADGRSIEIHHQPLADGGWVSTHDDITSRLSVADRLEEKSLLLDATLDTIAQGLLMVDRDGVVTVANRRLGELLGLDADALEGRPTYDTIRGQVEAGTILVASVAAPTPRVQSGMNVAPSLFRLRRSNGRVLEVHRVERADGSVLSTFTDVTDRERSEVELREKTALLDVTLENMHQGLMMVDAAGVVRICNQNAMTLLDLPPELMRSNPSFESVRNFQLSQQEFGRSPSEVRAWVAAGGMERSAHTYERERPNGTVLEIRTVPLEDGSAVRTYADVTERKRAELALARSEERLALALDVGSDGLWDHDLRKDEAWCSDRWWTILGYHPGELESSGHTWRALLHPDDKRRVLRLLSDHLEGRAPVFECEHRLRRKGGSWAWLLTRGRVVDRDESGTPIRFVGTHIDITARKIAEERVAHMAHHDPLTDLPNRTRFRERLERRLSEIVIQGGSCAVLCLDLDRFKAVNDTLGHHAGDRLLVEVARRLKAELGRNDIVARLGGDEFAILLGRTDRRRRVVALIERLIATVQMPIALDGHLVHVGLSVGGAMIPESGLDAETVFKRADLALYRSKAEGRSTYRLFEQEMDAKAVQRRGLEDDLGEALRNGELTLHYQPQARTGSGELVGFEALVRWHHPEQGLIPPATFIPIAEETGLILSIGEWVLKAACREASRWRPDLNVAVNLSAQQLQTADLPRLVLAILSETGLSPARLKLEVTETAIIRDMDRALMVLRRLKSLGVRIGMDDFGTGYSSLTTLQAFQFDELKIDRSFVNTMTESPQSAAIVRAVVSLGRSLGMAVVAEGVENQEQRRLLAEEDCEIIQGYLIGRPQPIAAFGDEVYGAGPVAACVRAARLATLRATATS